MKLITTRGCSKIRLFLNALLLLGSVGFSGFTLNAEALAAGSCAHDGDAFHCVRYIKNYDGDTITFDIPSVHPMLGKRITVRVQGIDAGEKRTRDVCEKRISRQAQQEVEQMLTGARRIDLVNSKRGKYFRVVADIIVDGKSLSEHLLSERLAVRYDGGTKPDTDWCRL